MRHYKWLVPVILVAAALLFYVWSGRNGDGAAAPRYSVATVTRGDIVQTVNTAGQLSPRSAVEVSSQISGLVTEVHADFNSRVERGQVLARIDPSTFEQALRQAEADLAAARANHELLVLNARRTERLLDRGLATPQEHDEIQAQLQQSEAGLLTREAAVENARVELGRTTITSPINGIVIFKQIEVGKTVVSSLSAPTLFVIAQDLTQMRILAPISEVDVGLVEPGQDVTFTVDAMPEREFRGRLTQIRNPYTPPDDQQQQAGQQTPIASFDAVIEVDNPDLELRPGLTANVRVIVDRREDTLRVPNSALRVRLPPEAIAATGTPARVDRGDPSGTVLYRLPSSDPAASPEAVVVRLGISDGLMTEVLDGLSEGDQVVTGVPESSTDRRRRSPFS